VCHQLKSSALSLSKQQLAKGQAVQILESRFRDSGVGFFVYNTALKVHLVGWLQKENLEIEILTELILEESDS
jgi:hypothetical protein